MNHEQKPADPLKANQGTLLPAVVAAGGSIARLIAAVMPKEWSKETDLLTRKAPK